MTLPDESWREHAACVGLTDIFFVPLERGAGIPWIHDPAKQVCAACPVLADCRAWVRANPQKHGIWAGMDPAERERDRRALDRRRERRRVALSTTV